ncbi:MAG: HTH domain-containing protein, partial [Thermoguttaceae bacterium]|nr:HTH domain-containing protein [Thermoguttaceae bacterium]
VTGTEMAKACQVSRQIIVSDIAALKNQGFAVLSTNRGYLLTQPDKAFRVFKVRHTGAEMEAEDSGAPNANWPFEDDAAAPREGAKRFNLRLDEPLEICLDDEFPNAAFDRGALVVELEGEFGRKRQILRLDVPAALNQ